MADTAPEIKPAEVLAASRQKVETPIFAAGAVDAQKEAQDRITAAAEKTNKINEAREKDPDNFKATVEATAKPPDFTNSQMEEVATALGEDINTADTITNTLQPVAQYLEGSRAALLKGTDVTTELTAAGLTAVDIQKKVAEVLINRGRLLEKFPDLKVAFEGAANQGALNAFVEQALARDPRFQAEMAKVLAEIHKKAKEIESSTQAEEKKNLTDQRDPLKKMQKSLVGQIKTTLGERGLSVAQQAQIEKLIETGTQPQDIIEMVKINLKLDPVFDNYKDFNDAYNLHDKEFQGYTALLNQEMNDKNQNGTYKRPGEVARLQALITQASARRQTAEQSRTSVREAYKLSHPAITTDPQFESEFQKYTAANSILKEDGPLARTLETTVRNQIQLTSLENQIKQLNNDPKNAEAEKKKADLLKQLEASVDVAMSEFLEQKYKDYVDDQNILINASIKEAEAQNKDWKAAGLKNIKDYMDKWSKFDGKKYSRDNGAIGTSLKDMATKSAYGEDGVRQILAERAGFQLDPEKLKNTIATEVTGTATAYSALSPEQKTKADAIIAQRTTEFEEIVTEQGEKFKERLFVEYNAAKGFMDKIGHGELSLTDDQVEILNTQFASLEKTIEKSGLFKALKEKGLVPDSKKKWIIMLLILLGGAALTMGIAPAAVAAAGAAKGLGTAAWSEGVV